MKLTVDNLRAMYDFLIETEPFVHWNLPAGEDVKFSISRSEILGWHQQKGEQHEISISCLKHSHSYTLLSTMAHEIIHLHLQHNRCDDKGMHGKAFRTLARRVALCHGFDPKDL